MESLNLPASLPPAITQNIINGSIAAFGEFPYQVMVTKSVNGYDKFICGGSIINTLFILTAAHCVADTLPSHLNVIAGSQNISNLNEIPTSLRHSQIRPVKSILIHEEYVYTKYKMFHDIAILKLQYPLKYNSRIKNIGLPNKLENFNGIAVVTGWGSTNLNGSPSSELKKVELDILPNEECSKIVSEITDEKLCLKESHLGASCSGDSGGPAACTRGQDLENSVLCGVVSYGFSCSIKGHPGIYVKVSRYIDWIKNGIQKLSSDIVTTSKPDQIPMPIPSSTPIPNPAITPHPGFNPGTDPSRHPEYLPGSVPNPGHIPSYIPGRIPSYNPTPNPFPVGGSMASPCPSNKFFCSFDLRCIPIEHKCDGHSDCSSGTDEMGCSNFVPSAPPAFPRFTRPEDVGEAIGDNGGGQWGTGLYTPNMPSSGPRNQRQVRFPIFPSNSFPGPTIKRSGIGSGSIPNGQGMFGLQPKIQWQEPDSMGGYSTSWGGPGIQGRTTWWEGPGMSGHSTRWEGSSVQSPFGHTEGVPIRRQLTPSWDMSGIQSYNRNMEGPELESHTVEWGDQRFQNHMVNF